MDLDSCASSLTRSAHESHTSRPLVFMFAGNLGVPQNLENDIEGFLKADLTGVGLWIVGGGVMLDSLKAKYEERAGDKLRFCGRQPRLEMPKWYAQADALIISLTDAYQLTLPGKFQSYLKTGKPLLGFISGATRLFIEGMPVSGVEEGGSGRLGWTAAPDDVQGIASAYRTMAESIREGQGNVFGENCRRLSERLFERGKQIERLRALMEFNAEKQRRGEAERIQ